MNKYASPAARCRLLLFYSLNVCTYTEGKPVNRTKSRRSSLVDGSRGLKIRSDMTKGATETLKQTADKSGKR